MRLSPMKKMFLRSGIPPQGGRSRNSVTRELEAGVSVYEGAVDERGVFLCVPSPAAFWALGHLMDRPIYEVDGEVVGVGSDGEPVLADCRVVRIIPPTELGGREFLTDREARQFARSYEVGVGLASIGVDSAPGGARRSRDHYWPSRMFVVVSPSSLSGSANEGEAVTYEAVADADGVRICMPSMKAEVADVMSCLGRSSFREVKGRCVRRSSLGHPVLNQVSEVRLIDPEDLAGFRSTKPWNKTSLRAAWGSASKPAIGDDETQPGRRIVFDAPRTSFDGGVGHQVVCPEPPEGSWTRLSSGPVVQGDLAWNWKIGEWAPVRRGDASEYLCVIRRT